MHRLSRIEPVQPKNEITVTRHPNDIIKAAASDMEVVPIQTKKLIFN